MMTKQTSFGSGIEQQNISFVQDTLLPQATMWAEAIVRDLIGDSKPKLFVRFDFNSLMRGDNASRAAYYAAMFNTGSMSSNDIREKEGFNPRDGGDEYVIGAAGGGLHAPPPSGNQAGGNQGQETGLGK
jgi:HK97 family phage portal protein